MSLTKPKIKKPQILANFSTFTKGWLKAAEASLGNDKETFAMVVLLFKKFSKQKLDYETLFLSVEELLPQDHVPKLLQELSDLISGQDNSDCDSFESLDDATKQSGDFEMQSLKRKADLHVEIAPTPPESDSEEVLVYPTPALSVQGSPEKPLTKRQKTDKESFQYIISSLDRHADSQVLLKKGNTPIPIFKKIIQKSMNLEYVELEELEKDVDKMLNTLARQGHVVDRVRKHYEYLVSYYFPSAVVQGKRNR